jgi:hypothetical protein
VVNDCVLGSDGKSRFSAAMDVNSAGNKAWTYTLSSSNDYPSAMVAKVPSGKICGTTITDVTLAGGQAAYNSSLLTPNWGDFATVATDPDGTGIWVHTEFANASSTWSSEVGRTYE